MNGADNNRIPPHSREAEEAVLGAMMMSKDIVPNTIARIADPTLFYFDIHRDIFSAMKKLFDDSLPIDQITVSDKLKRLGQLKKVGGSYYVTGLLESTPSTSNVNFHINIVIEKALHRQLISLGVTMTADGYNDSTASMELIESYREKINLLSRGNTINDYNYSEELSRVVDGIQREESKGLLTGFESIDRMTGGFQPGNLIVLGGRTSQGKTSLAVNFAYNLAVSGKKVLFVSLEMTKSELFKKIISLGTGIPYEKLRSGWLTTEEREIINDKGREFYNLDNFILMDDLYTLNSIHKSVITHKPDVLIVDFIQHMRFSKGENRAYQIEEIMKGLKHIAKIEKCVVIILSQINRGSEPGDKLPRAENLKGSGSLEESGDVVLLIHWLHKYDQREPEGKVCIFIAKNRHGRTGNIILEFEPKSGKYTCDNKSEMKSALKGNS